jgi:exodeoxyribonuclease VII large subunit
MDNVNSPDNSGDRRIYSVFELTQSIKSLLEGRFAFVWISGEISNYRMPSSGHCYFTLKDDRAQINAVMFKGQKRNLNFDLEDGQTIIGLGRLSVYEPRGTYQIILEYIEPKGVGALQLAFEQLKKRLFDEGLFDDRYKKPLPIMPRKISLVTSPTGAVVHDMMNVIFRRFPNIHIEIVPVKVQGTGAVDEIVRALQLLDERYDTDLIIVARGGGSLEDLQAFNSEAVARAVFDARIPVVSAVGHEIDYTIADFVADLRAPTPSAAAELTVPLKKDLCQRHINATNALKSNMTNHLNRKRLALNQISKWLIDPRKGVYDLRLRMDDLHSRLIRLTFRGVRQKKEQLKWRTNALISNNPNSLITKLKERNDVLIEKLLIFFDKFLNDNRHRLRELSVRINALNPAAILDRGYSITRTIPGAVVIRYAEEVSVQQKVEVVLAKGSLVCHVERKRTDGEKNF